ncbi:31486_t:CDS:2, partial [Racocetra persica]
VTMLPPPLLVKNSADKQFQYAKPFANSQGGVYNNFLNLTEEIRNRQKNMQLIDCSFELLTDQQLESVAVMINAGLLPREIILTLQQKDKSTLVTNNDVYNA